MKIRTQLLIGFLLIFFLNLFVAYIFFATTKKIEEEQFHRVTSLRLLKEIADVAHVKMNYVDYQVPAASVEWDKEYQDVHTAISEVLQDVDESEVTELVSSIKTHLTKADTAFRQLVELTDNPEATEMKQETTAELTKKIDTATDGMTDASMELGEHATQDLERVQNQGEQIVVVALIILFALLIVFWLIFYRELVVLSNITKIINDISKGMIQTSLPISTLEQKNEIGDLARAFDRTLVSLKLAMQRQQKPPDSTPSTPPVST